MSDSPNLFGFVLILILSAFVISMSPEPAFAQCSDPSTFVTDGISTARGKPFQAKQVTTIVTYLNEGAKNVRVMKSNFFRDSRGRLRIERFYNGTDDPPEGIPSDIIIVDDCYNSAVLLPDRQTAKLSKFPVSAKGSDQPVCEEIDPKKVPDMGPTALFENLGHKFIGAVEIRGQRFTYYSSAKAKLSSSPPISVHEDWCSVSLDTPMGGHFLNDEPKNEITTIVTDVLLIEPAPNLFEIPDGYQLVQAASNPHTLKN